MGNVRHIEALAEQVFIYSEKKSNKKQFLIKKCFKRALSRYRGAPFLEIDWVSAGAPVPTSSEGWVRLGKLGP